MTTTERKQFYIKMTSEEAAYIAGLFDGEGCVSYKQYMRKRPHNIKPYPTWQIRLEIAMTDKSILVWVMEVLGVGTISEKNIRVDMLWVGRSNGVGVALTRMRFMFVVLCFHMPT